MPLAHIPPAQAAINSIVPSLPHIQPGDLLPSGALIAAGDIAVMSACPHHGPNHFQPRFSRNFCHYGVSPAPHIHFFDTAAPVFCANFNIGVRLLPPSLGNARSTMLPAGQRRYLRRQYPTSKPSKACTNTARLGDRWNTSVVQYPFHFSAGVSPCRF